MSKRFDPLKSAITDIAFQGIRQGITIKGVESYTIVMDERGKLMIRVDPPMSSNTLLGRGPRYFLISVKEQM